VILGILIHGIRVRRRDLIVPISAFAVAVIGILHAMIDFSLQIPGYAIVVFALLGAGLAQSFASKSRAAGEETGSRSRLRPSDVQRRAPTAQPEDA
jgi:hypothetical protein